MTELQEIVFISEIVLQIKITQRAAEVLQIANRNLDKVEVWSSIQSILVSTGNVSKILWPSNKKYNLRGVRLRALLKVENDNILNDRTFRNHFEHYDERIEEWFSNQDCAVYTDLAMNPSLSGDMFVKSIHRGYNSFNNSLIFREAEMDLSEILKALEMILENCKLYTRV